ncbi:hypothetical protein RB614_20305 [Phytohabitans sp. ZYX-F-186]|uniref:DUF1289 domain-containing protein n=1 Tax=Phytohabitans maris TaxID=3071409 RepID=A0ABU0ZK19_9ACTN|nr:hypothetical protein [Phytohabitans sp. ZYX-F-186]MDQ7906861.1 hypothetical protein [Phytohabitans sp. ZYX-F-186]
MANATPPPGCTCGYTGRCRGCGRLIAATATREGRSPAQRTGIAALTRLSTKDAA